MKDMEYYNDQISGDEWVKYGRQNFWNSPKSNQLMDNPEFPSNDYMDSILTIIQKWFDGQEDFSKTRLSNSYNKYMHIVNFDNIFNGRIWHYSITFHKKPRDSNFLFEISQEEISRIEVFAGGEYMDVEDGNVLTALKMIQDHFNEIVSRAYDERDEDYVSQ